MKLMIWLGIVIGGAAGSWIGSQFDNGNLLGTWGILLGGAGSIAGIFLGYKIGKSSGY